MDKVTPSQITPKVRCDMQALYMEPLLNHERQRMNICPLRLLKTIEPQRAPTYEINFQGHKNTL